MKRLSKDQIEEEIKETDMANVTEPKMAPIENDYLNNGHTNPCDPQFRWNGPSFKDRPAPATNEELAAMRAAAPKKRATFFERMEAAKKTGEVVRPSVVILGKDSYEKVQ